MLGRYVYQIKNDPRRASSILQDAGETPRYRYRAWAYNALATIQANEAGQLDQAISNYKKAIELKSEEAPQCSLPAWLGRHLCPKSLSFMYCNLGQALVQKGNVPEAERDYSKAKSLGPDSPYLHSLSGDILRAEGKWDEAASEYRVAIGEGLTNDSRIYYELARILWLKGDFDHSLENFRKASDLDPNHKKQIEALILGLTLWLEGNCDPAGEQFRIASQLDPRLKEQIEALTSNKPAVPSKGRC
jgi:tetratricopeptide (TPR) repeat protein